LLFPKGSLTLPPPSLRDSLGEVSPPPLPRSLSSESAMSCVGVGWVVVRWVGWLGVGGSPAIRQYCSLCSPASAYLVSAVSQALTECLLRGGGPLLSWVEVRWAGLEAFVAGLRLQTIVHGNGDGVEGL